MTAGPGGPAALADEPTLASLGTQTHFHGLAVDRSNPSRLYLATHHGLYLIDPRGQTQRVSRTRDDFMGFTPHPTDPATLYASGHPLAGGNLGFIMSKDGGATWLKLSDGAGGPVDFHQMDVSKANPKVIYGAFGGLQRSMDGGQTWNATGQAPEGMIGFTTSSRDANALFAATQTGVFRSTDSGQSWATAHAPQRTATMVHVTQTGTIYAFFLGKGLWKADEAALDWKPLTYNFGQRYVLHLATDPANDKRLFAIAVDAISHAPVILASGDGGESWSEYGRATP